VTSAQDRGDEKTQYFEAEPTVPSKPKEIELVLPDVYLRLCTDSGVFSGDKVDSGTRYLLQEHPSIPESAQSILDLGCGYGPIALTAASRAPRSTVWGIDVNNRALALARANATANGLTNVHFGTMNEVPKDLTFDLIMSNPPIRIGKAALHELLMTWMTRLSPNATVWMVVHKHLGSDSLADWLTAQGWPTSRLSSRKGFRLLETRLPSPAAE